MAAMLEKLTTAAIITNGAVFATGLALPAYAETTEMVEHVILGFFTVEMVLRWRAADWRLAHFRGWHLFDAIVVLLSVATVLPGSAVMRLARLAKLVKVLHLGRHAAQLRVVALARRREGVAA
jgi:hypothetical protein